ncbi:MAG: four helix bundle protein [Patescibacteria group bacterium]|nr:four helix bundle protein [Patescibacteria group bacterium]
MEFQDILSYKKAEEVAEDIWSIVLTWSWFPKKAIGMQLVTSVDSISANMAEGHGRFFYKEKLRFYFYARASAQETICWLKKSAKRKLIRQSQCNSLVGELESICKLINTLIKSTKHRL